MTIRKWAVVVDGDVAGTISIDTSNPATSIPRFVAAYDSDPKIVPITTDQPVAFGWKWDGINFILEQE
jgi:hypothetical protein